MTRWPSPGSPSKSRTPQANRTYYNSFVTDLDVNPGNVAELAACGRARWKIESVPQRHTERSSR